MINRGVSNRRSSGCCECTPVVESRFREEDRQLPSTAIVEAVAAAEGVAPVDLEPLYNEIDLDMIDQLFEDDGDPSTSPKLLQFSVAGWNVFVRGDGAIRVCDPDRPTTEASAFEKPIAD